MKTEQNPSIERVRIDELIEAYVKKHGRKYLHREVADYIFSDDAMGDLRKRQLISRWNNGFDLRRMTPKHIMRMASMFKVSNVGDLFSSTPNTPIRNDSRRKDSGGTKGSATVAENS